MSETGKMTAKRNERVTLPRRAFLRGMTGAALTLGAGVAASAQGPFSYIGRANPTGQGTNPGTNPATNPGMYFGPETVQVSLADGSALPARSAPRRW